MRDGITKHQFSVLKWLEAYPQVHIHTAGKLGSERCFGITPWWRSETDRLAMERAVGLLINENIIPYSDCKMKPRKNHQSGKTPKVISTTLETLKKQGLVTIHKYFPESPGMAQQNYYQLTTEGRKAAHRIQVRAVAGQQAQNDTIIQRNGFELKDRV